MPRVQVCVEMDVDSLVDDHAIIEDTERVLEELDGYEYVTVSDIERFG